MGKSTSSAAIELVLNCCRACRIGQKLSERVESFHFTHYINSFRRLLNVELSNEMVKPHLRDGVGLMVLPVSSEALGAFHRYIC
jgi:hypothetical protein